MAIIDQKLTVEDMGTKDAKTTIYLELDSYEEAQRLWNCIFFKMGDGTNISKDEFKPNKIPGLVSHTYWDV